MDFCLKCLGKGKYAYSNSHYVVYCLTCFGNNCEHTFGFTAVIQNNNTDPCFFCKNVRKNVFLIKLCSSCSGMKKFYYRKNDKERLRTLYATAIQTDEREERKCVRKEYLDDDFDYDIYDVRDEYCYEDKPLLPISRKRYDNMLKFVDKANAKGIYIYAIINWVFYLTVSHSAKIQEDTDIDKLLQDLTNKV